MLDDATFCAIRDLVGQTAGIVLSDAKKALVAARLARRLKEVGDRDPRAYLERLRHDRSGTELVALIDAISTNVTYFFRESPHFDFTSEKVTEWVRAGQRRLRVWCAASSTGEEPYSIAITLAEIPGIEKVDVRILATDISTKVLSVAMSGLYDEKKIADSPSYIRERYFERRADGQVQVVRRLRDWIRFRRFNLTELPSPLAGPLDLIFCRNVMIYFDNPRREKLAHEFSRLLAPGGFLIIGHSESLAAAKSAVRLVQPSIYQRAA